MAPPMKKGTAVSRDPVLLAFIPLASSTEQPHYMLDYVITPPLSLLVLKLISLPMKHGIFIKPESGME